MTMSIPTTTPMLKALEPNRSPTDNAGVFDDSAKAAIKISGVDVIAERRTKPIEVSLRPVISLRSSTDCIT